MNFYTSDEHYCHKNVMKYCNRPFDSVEQMNTVLIWNHNQKVGKKDKVYHLGDMVFGKTEQWIDIVKQLNGKHYLIIGSHDKINPDIGTLFEDIQDVMDIKVDGQYVFLSHYAHRVWPRSHYDSWHLYGHSHGNLGMFGYSFDVGVDAHNGGE